MISRPLFTFYTAHYNLHQERPERPECPERDNDAHDTLKHAAETQAAAGSRPPSLTLSHGTLSPTHTDTDKSARVRNWSTEQARTARNFAYETSPLMADFPHSSPGLKKGLRR